VANEHASVEPEFTVDEEPAGGAAALSEVIGGAIQRESGLRKNLNQAALRYRQEVFIAAELLRDVIDAKETRCDQLIATLRKRLSETEGLDPEMREVIEQRLESVERIQRAFDVVFERHRVQQFTPSGECDPETCAVQGTVPGTGLRPGTIVAVLRPGYRWRGELLRPADVTVAE
jgi:molecular chaperone GrpE (heat shock protein)